MIVRSTKRRAAFQNLCLIVILLFVDCSFARASDYKYIIPEKTKDGWETASLTDEKLNPALINVLFSRINDNNYKNISSVVIVKNGRLVIEEYFPRVDFLGERNKAIKRISPLQLYSATKSVTSILIGIAMDRGLIHSVNDKISTFFPEFADIFTNRYKSDLSLKDFLSMSAGLSWDEWSHSYNDPRNDAVAALLSPDSIRYILERPMVSAPGAKFTYSSGNSLVLGEIIRKVSGLPADKFAERYLFEPLAITDFYWAKTSGDIVETGGGLFLRPRDMAKIGFLFLNGGRWEGKQIVSEEWIKQSTANQAGTMNLPSWVQATDGYGYQWWLGSLKAGDQTVKFYGARGRAGQYILNFPELQMVAVFTGLNDNILMNQPLDMLQRYILPAALPHSPNSASK